MRYVVAFDYGYIKQKDGYYKAHNTKCYKAEEAFVFTDRGAAEVIAAQSGGVVQPLDVELGDDEYTKLRAKIFTLASDYEHSANQYEIAMRNDRKAKEQRRQEWFVTASVFRNVASQLRSTLP